MPTTTSIDDFEDGDVAEWSGSTGLLSATTSALSGTYSGEFRHDDQFGSFFEVSSPRVSDAGATSLELSLVVDGIASSGAELKLPIVNSNGSVINELWFTDAGEILWRDNAALSETQIGTFSVGSTSRYRVDCDFTAGTATVLEGGAELAAGLALDATGAGIAGIDLAWNGVDSGTDAVRVDDIDAIAGPPGAPTDADLDIEDDETATATWSEPADGPEPDHYDVQISTDGDEWTQIATPSAGTTSHTELIARSVDTVQVRVRASNEGETSDWVYTSTLSTNATGLTITDTGGTTIDLSWDDPDANDGTDVLLAEASGTDASDYSVDQSVGADASTATVTGLEHGERYYARVQATYAGADGTPAPVSNEVGTVTDLPAPTLDSVTASTLREITLSLTLSDNSTDGDVLVERSTDGGSTWVEAGTIADLSATSWTDTGLDDGTTYAYRLTRRTDHTSAQSGTASATTVAPAPVLDDLTVDGDVLEATGTDTGNAELRHEIEIQRTNTTGSSWSQSGADIAAQSGDGNTITGSTAALLDGERYDVRLRTIYPDASATSGTQSATAVLPDEDQPVLNNGVEDEIAVDRETQTTNYGSVRVEYRETGAADWIDWGVVPYDRLDPVVAGLEDGERYEIRLRTETEHVTGAWTEPVAITTKFPGATQLVVTSAGETSVDLAFEDNADNEDGVWLERRELFRDGWGEWGRVKDLGPNPGTGTVQATDTEALPETTYQYRVVPYTEHSQAVSDSVETTTQDDGVRTDRVPAEGWHVVVETSDGATISPTIVGEPVHRPRLNDLPTVEIPVPDAARWSDSGEWERQPMRVYHDGDRLPIEQVQRVRQEPGQAMLVGVGGVALRERVAVDVIEQDAHLVVRDLLDDTPLTRNVDDPDAETVADLIQQSADSEAEWDGVLESAPGAADVYETSGTGRLRTRQTAYFREAEDTQFQNGTVITVSAQDVYSDQQAVAFEAAGATTFHRSTAATDHEIPAADARFAIRVGTSGGGHPGFTVRLNDTTVESFPADFFAGDRDVSWFDLGLGDALAGALSVGEHVVELDFDEGSSAEDASLELDCTLLYDGRYDPGLGNTVSSAVVQGVHEYPQEIDIQTVDAVSVRQVTGGRLEADINNTGGSQAVAISNDSGATWIEAANTETVEGAFADGSTSIRARFTLGGYDADPSTSPGGRTAPQAVDLYSLFADLEDTPLLANRSWDQTLLTILQDIARYGNFIFEIRWDADEGGLTVEWTQAGQRTATVDPDLVDYQVETDYSSIHRRAVIYGTSTPRSTKDVIANLGEWQDLDHDWLLETGERVVDSNTGVEYERSVDYELRPNAGEIRTLPTGDIDDGDALDISYDRRIRGSFKSQEYDPDDSEYEVFVDDVPSITTERNADAAALAIVQGTNEPLRTASVTVDIQPGGQSLVEAVDLDQLPVDEPLEVWSVDNSPGQVTMQLGNREEVSETVSRIQERLGATSRKV